MDDLPEGMGPAPAPTTDGLQAAYQVTQAINPDEHARAERVARETGVPIRLVKENPAGFETAFPPPELHDLPRKAPVLAKFASEPRNMASVRDDLDKLSAIEWALGGGMIAGVSEAGGPKEYRYQPPAWYVALEQGIAEVRLGFEKTRQKVGLGPAWSPFAPAITEGPEGRLVIPTEQELPALVERGAQAAEEAASRDLHARGLVARAWVGSFEAAPPAGTR